MILYFQVSVGFTDIGFITDSLISLKGGWCFWCLLDVDECQSSPCIHGNCSDLINEYRCQCLPGYDGLQCQIGIEDKKVTTGIR